MTSYDLAVMFNNNPVIAGQYVQVTASLSYQVDISDANTQANTVLAVKQRCDSDTSIITTLDSQTQTTARGADTNTSSVYYDSISLNWLDIIESTTEDDTCLLGLFVVCEDTITIAPTDFSYSYKVFSSSIQAQDTGADSLPSVEELLSREL